MKKLLWVAGAAVFAVLVIGSIGEHSPPTPSKPRWQAGPAELVAITALIQARGYNCPAAYSATFALSQDEFGTPLRVLCNNAVWFSVTLRQADLDAGKSNVESFFNAIVKPL